MKDGDPLDVDRPRLAFFVSSYRSSAQLGRLLRTLRTAEPTAELLVFHNVFASEVDPAVVSAVGGHLFTAQTPIVWGDISLDQARWRVMRWALEHLEFDWLVLLSEQDYPIAPTGDLGRYLAGSGADIVLETEPIDEIADPRQRRDCDLRYNYQRVPLPAWHLTARLPGSLRRALATVLELGCVALERAQRRVHVYRLPPALHLPSKVGVRVSGDRAVPADWRVWWGSAWYAISRRGTQRLLELVDELPEVVRYYERAVIPSESLVHTLLCNAPDVRVHRDSLHHIRWSNTESGRPDVLTEDDLGELLGSGRFFARKFDVEDGLVLDLLDRHVLPDPAGPPAP